MSPSHGPGATTPTVLVPDVMSLLIMAFKLLMSEIHDMLCHHNSVVGSTRKAQ
jgi:hypothetical protein